jgi:hypothetical protein
MVVPRQSCEKVVEATKSMSDLSMLHNLSVRGLVDRDRRCDEEVDALRGHGVLVADVAEVENLLCLPEALEAAAKRVKAADVAKAKAAPEGAAIAEMAKVVDQQALARVLAEIQFRLNGFGPRIGRSDAAKLATDLQASVAGINVAATVAKCRRLCDGAITANDDHTTLRRFNSKGVSSFVAASFGIKKDVYCRMVLHFIKTEPDSPIAGAMRHAIDGTPDVTVVTPTVIGAGSPEGAATAAVW